MRIEIPRTYAVRLARLADTAGLSSARWVRAAIRAAEADQTVAQQIEKAAPPSEHGGARPGAGRPRGSRGGSEPEEEEDDEDDQDEP